MDENEALRPQGGASRARSGEPDASKGDLVHIVPLNPAYKGGACGARPGQGIDSRVFQRF